MKTPVIKFAAVNSKYNVIAHIDVRSGKGWSADCIARRMIERAYAALRDAPLELRGHYYSSRNWSAYQ